MTYWLMRGRERMGPFSSEELVWKTRGDLNVLVCRREGGSFPLDRWGWKLARLFPELMALQQMLPDNFS